MQKGKHAEYRLSLNADNTLEEITAQGLSGDEDEEEIDQVIG
jgi:hypothetical protein